MWGKHENAKCLWKDAEQSETRKKNWGTSVYERAIYYKILHF